MKKLRRNLYDMVGKLLLLLPVLGYAGTSSSRVAVVPALPKP